MKLNFFLFAVAAAQCNQECLTDAGNFCEHKGDLIRNKLLYDDAKDRYDQQEKDYNRLAVCYNALQDAGGLDRNWNNHCGESGEPCRNDQPQRECCITNDWEELKETTQILSSWASTIDNQFETLEGQMTRFLSCLSGNCIA